MRRLTITCLCALLLSSPCLAGQIPAKERSAEYEVARARMIAHTAAADSAAARQAVLPSELGTVRDRADRSQDASVIGGIGILTAGLLGLDMTRGVPGKAKRPWICLSVTGGIMLLIAVLPMRGTGPVPSRLP